VKIAPKSSNFLQNRKIVAKIRF